MLEGLKKLLQCKHIKTTPYHHQANGILGEEMQKIKIGDRIYGRRVVIAENPCRVIEVSDIKVKIKVLKLDIQKTLTVERK